MLPKIIIKNNKLIIEGYWSFTLTPSTTSSMSIDFIIPEEYSVLDANNKYKIAFIATKNTDFGGNGLFRVTASSSNNRIHFSVSNNEIGFNVTSGTLYYINIGYIKMEFDLQ